MKKKIFVYSCLIVAAMVVVITFVSSTNYIQLAIASLFYPVLAYAIFKCFPRQVKVNLIKEEPVVLEKPVPTSVNTVDTDKRAFLKLIGTVGLSYFLFSVFSRKSETLFFNKAVETEKAMLDSSGNKIDPAERQPTDGYQISEIDEGDTIFTGYLKKGGSWFIMRADNETGAFRYTKGETDFPGNWQNRERLSYDYFSNVFS